VPFHGSGHACVAPDVAEAWLARVLALPAPRTELAFAVAQLARRSGDRARDVDDAARVAALAALREARAPEETLRGVTEVVQATEEEERRIFGEALPAGLSIVRADENEERTAPGP
jgi:hypothetical protein